MTITPNERRPAVIAAAALAFLLLGLGLPRLAGNLWGLPASRTMWSLREGGAEPPEALRSAAAGLALASRLTGNGFFDLEQGYALLALGDARASREATARGLARAPGNPAGWLRLARLRLEAGDRKAAAAALRLALLSGAVVPDIMPDRLRLGLRLLPDLDPDTQDLLRRQIRLLAALNPAAFRGLTGEEVQALIRLNRES